MNTMEIRLNQVPMFTAKIPWSVLFGANRLRFFRAVREAIPDQPAVRLRFGSRTVILVFDAEAAGEVLLERAEDYSKGLELSKYARPLLGRGLLGSEGDFHKKQRRTIIPVFAPRRIAAYAEGMAEAAEEMVAGWRDGETVDFHREMTRLTLRIVGETLFGVRGIADEADELGGAVTTAMDYFVRVLRSPVLPPFAGIPFWRPEVRRAIHILNRKVYALIAQRRQSGTEGSDLLSLLLSARDEDGNPMPDDQVRDEAMTLFLAGHETTANALSWTFYLLAKHPAQYALVEEEIRTALQGRTPTHDDTARLTLTLQAIKEAMRLYPPVFIFFRRSRRDTSLLGYHVPARTSIGMNVYMVHRDPRIFPDPERFDLTRFTPEAEKARPRFAYLPFGGGPRVCIGAAFASMEAQIIVSTVLQRVRISLNDPENEQASETLITLRPKGSLPLRIAKRA